MTRAEILEAARKCVCGDRDEQYGSPEESFDTIADLWNAYLHNIIPKSVPDMICAADVAVMMALFKIARIAKGVKKDDSWIDAAGYIACGAEIAGGYCEAAKTPQKSRKSLSRCPMCGCDQIDNEGGERSCAGCGAVWSELYCEGNVDIRVLSYGKHTVEHYNKSSEKG